MSRSSQEPNSKLEDSHGLIIKGFTRITTVDVRGVRIDAIEMRDLRSPNGIALSKGLAVSLREGGERPNENRAFVDYREIDSLLNAIDRNLTNRNQFVCALGGRCRMGGR